MPTSSSANYSTDDQQMKQSLADEFDLQKLVPEFYQNPYAIYKVLRELAPVKVLADGSLFLTRYEDLKLVYSDAKRFSSDKKIEFAPKFGNGPLFEHHTSSLVFSDPPLHTQVRQALVNALSPRAIEAMLAGLEKVVQELLEKLEDSNEFELIDQFASAIPIEIIGNLLGIPPSERGPLRAWSLAILGALEPTLSADQLSVGNRSVEEFLSYLAELIDRRRTENRDPDIDVVTRLIGLSDSRQITLQAVLHNCIFLLNAGHETTTNLIGNGLDALARFPQQRDLLVRQINDQNLVKSAVEEFLRFESSNQLGNRRSLVAFEMRGKTFAAGTRIHLCIGAANRDPEQFELPDELNIQRQPNRHLAFGYGAHVCAGLNLARLEGRIAIAAFLRKFPDYSVVEREIGGRARFRGFKRLQIRVQ